MILSSTFRKALLATAGFIAFGATLPATAQTTQSIAAVVNDDIVTTYDLRQRVLFILATTGVERDEATLQRIQSQALRNLIDEQLQMQESRKFDQTIRDEEVNRSVVDLISRNGLSPDEVAQRLAAVGVSLGTLQNQVRAEIAWQRIVSGLFGSRVRISDAQIDETYTRLTANAEKPSYRVAEIYIEATPEIGGQEGALQGAQAMIQQATQGAPFQLLAQQFSSSPSAARGGDIGWVNEGELRPEIDTAIQALEKGGISEPIQVPGGVYVIVLVDKRISNPDTLYNLQQIRSEISEDNGGFDAAKARVEQALTVVTSCNTMKDSLDDMDDVTHMDMGELKETEMNELIANALNGVEVGQGSAVIEGPGTAVSFFVCEKSLTGENVPTRNQVEDRLIDQQIAQASKRHLRDLRRDAAITLR
jgi:peptidyl-prolyl cis-trans isomerase SurA